MNYDEYFNYKDGRSGLLTNGIERSAHRALLFSTGLEEQERADDAGTRSRP